MRADTWVLGISASHNGSACLMRNGKIVVAIQEERLRRQKRARLWPAEASLAVQYCLKHGGITASDLSLVVVCPDGSIRHPKNNILANPTLKLRETGVPFEYISHHYGHALGAMAQSGFRSASVLVIDGMGSPATEIVEDGFGESHSDGELAVSKYESVSLYVASGLELRPVRKWFAPWWISQNGGGMPYFRTFGGMYAAVASRIFGEPMEAGKVMGLAPLGNIRYHSDQFFTRAQQQGPIFSDELPELLSAASHWPEMAQEHADLARSVQNALEAGVLSMVEEFYDFAPSANLCFTGGVALNGILNYRLATESPYANLFVPPAADDAGTAIGAAYYGYWKINDEVELAAYHSDSLGCSYSNQDVRAAIRKLGIADKVTVRELDVTGIAETLASGSILAWFQSGSEFGPRALGYRSILGDARQVGIQDTLNSRVKGREAFRPFAPVVLEEHVFDWFERPRRVLRSPFMLQVWHFLESQQQYVPGVVHKDGSGRVQTIDESSSLHALLSAFYALTGVPILLNTSLNGPGQPIIELPIDALRMMNQGRVDGCVIGGLYISWKAKQA